MRKRDLLLRVRDQGQGFDCSKILSAPGSRKAFGLSGIHDRCSLLGGKMRIQSQAGQGTQVSFVFPVRVLQKESGSLEVEPLGRSLSNKIRILVVDDHEIVREGLTSILSLERDIEVVGKASNGKEALSLVRKLQPDVVLMDVLMPGIDGIEASSTIRSSVKGPSIIGLTVALDGETEEKMRKAGARMVLSKSTPVKQIVSAIRSSAVQHDSSSSENIKGDV
jgi:CheY-like chemotaxis protein